MTMRVMMSAQVAKQHRGGGGRTCDLFHHSIQCECAVAGIEVSLPVLPEAEVERDRLAAGIPHKVIASDGDVGDLVVLPVGGEVFW